MRSLVSLKNTHACPTCTHTVPASRPLPPIMTGISSISSTGIPAESKVHALARSCSGMGGIRPPVARNGGPPAEVNTDPNAEPIHPSLAVAQATHIRLFRGYESHVRRRFTGGVSGGRGCRIFRFPIARNLGVDPLGSLVEEGLREGRCVNAPPPGTCVGPRVPLRHPDRLPSRRPCAAAEAEQVVGLSVGALGRVEANTDRGKPASNGSRPVGVPRTTEGLR